MSPFFRPPGHQGNRRSSYSPSSFLEYCLWDYRWRASIGDQWKLVRKVRKLGVRVTITGGNGHFAGIGFNKLVKRLAS